MNLLKNQIIKNKKRKIKYFYLEHKKIDFKRFVNENRKKLWKL